jgi:uncharacterized protein involved in outer membrane biogenesis
VRWQRIALIAAAATATIVAAVVVITLGRLDSIVKNAIEQRGSALTKTSVTVGSVNVSLRDGTASVRDLRVANPPGFTAPYAFELGAISVRMALRSVVTDPLVIEEIRIDTPRVTCELSADGQSNIEQIRHAAEHPNAPAPSAGTPVPHREPADASAGRRLVIDLLSLRDGEVHVDARAVGGPDRIETLPGFELTNIGTKQGGATPTQVGRIVVTALARDVAVAVAATQLERYIGKGLGGQAGELLKQGGAGAIGKGLGDLLDNLLGK